MRLCRYGTPAQPVNIGFQFDECIVPFHAAVLAYESAGNPPANDPRPDDLLDLLPGGRLADIAYHVFCHLMIDRYDIGRLSIPRTGVLLPIPKPPKLLLLAGNYADHILERGGSVAERSATFPYVFMKPPSTTLIPTGAPIVIPKNAPVGVDWECELGVVIGRRVRNISEKEAGAAIAGYTIINDITQRQFKPNPGRQKRERDAFFDWQHGKWFDSFCPCGPCVTSELSIPDAQNLKIELTVNGEVKQQGSTAQMIFPVEAVIAFISTFVTLEPGDIISTGTPKGVGSATGTYLKPGDIVEASIEGIGTLRNEVVGE